MCTTRSFPSLISSVHFVRVTWFCFPTKHKTSYLAHYHIHLAQVLDASIPVPISYSMASVSATSLRLEPSLKLSSRTSKTTSSLGAVSVGWTKRSFPSLRSSRFRIYAAKPETVQKVCDIVRKQLALPPESELTPETTFTSLGADSLDTVEIVMGLEEEFGIGVEEESSENITCIQEAANLIEKLLEKKGGTK